MSSEALRLFKQLNLQLEREGRFQPRDKGLSLIECAAEVSGPARWGRSCLLCELRSRGRCGTVTSGASCRWGVLLQESWRVK